MNQKSEKIVIVNIGYDTYFCGERSGEKPLKNVIYAVGHGKYNFAFDDMVILEYYSN
jgi:hypothetical protein